MRRDERRHLAYQVERLSREGRSQRQIATALGIARRTVHRLLKENAKRRREGESVAEREIRPHTSRESKLDAYTDLMRAWLLKDKEKKRKKNRRLTAVRCLEMLRERGFTGKYTIVRERLKELRAELNLPAPTATPIETAPGQRGEFDWSPYELDGGLKVQLFHAVLRWSRAPALFAATDFKQTTTFRFLVAALEEWGGVPDEMLTDSMPGVVDRWELDEPILNARYVDFAAFYGFTALIAGRRKPKHKAVVERRFLFHEKNLLVGRTITSFAQYVELLDWWKHNKILPRDHPETGQSILDMFALEQAHLKPLPAHPYDTRDVFIHLVDDYGRVRLDTNHYPVSAPVGSRVYILAGPDRIEICDDKARRLLECERLPAGACIKLPPLHAGRVRYDLDELCERVGQWGEAAAEFAVGVRRTRRYAGPELVRLLGLIAHWSADDIVAAVEHAIDYGCFEVAKVMRILEMRFSPRRLMDLIAEKTRRRIEETMEDHPVSKRPLSSYESLEKGDRLDPDCEEDQDAEPADEEED